MKRIDLKCLWKSTDEAHASLKSGRVVIPGAEEENSGICQLYLSVKPELPKKSFHVCSVMRPEDVFNSNMFIWFSSSCSAYFIVHGLSHLDIVGTEMTILAAMPSGAPAGIQLACEVQDPAEIWIQPDMTSWDQTLI